MKLSITFLCYALVATVTLVSSYQNGAGPVGHKLSVLEKTSLASTGLLDHSNARLTFPPETPMPYDPPNYWFNTKIHTFGNTGLFGGLHAAVAYIFTLLIDLAAYEGKNIRQTICEGLAEYVRKPNNARIADLCSGVGISTQALKSAFPHSEEIVGVDTSPEMISMAKMIGQDSLFDKIEKSFHKKKEDKTPVRKPSFKIGNAESTGLPGGSFDLVTIMYAFHEAPFDGRSRMIREAHRLLKNGASLTIVDISPNYQPNGAMLAGEPYVLEYQKNIDRQLHKTGGFDSVHYKELIPGHVSVWVLNKSGGKAFKPKPAFLKTTASKSD